MVEIIKKPFLTIEQQIKLLESRGMKIDKTAESTLIREGYYAIVNGYKEPFIDKEATNNAKDDRYIQGTTFEHLHILFDVDRTMRECTFPLLIRAETTLRTIISYRFCERYPQEDAYLHDYVYCGKQQYFKPDSYQKNVDKLKAHLTRAHDNTVYPHDFIQHYLDKYGHVPLWVLVNVLTFGNISNLYSLLPRSLRNAICKTIANEQGIKFIKENELRLHIETLVDFRNVCAHDDRFYCARSGKTNDRTFADMVKALYTIVEQKEVSRYLRSMSEILDLLSSQPELQNKIIKEMSIGFKNGMISIP